VIYRLLKADETVSISARNRIRLRVGDAGALLVSANGSEPSPAGGAGEVRDLQFSRDEPGTR
jgi:hypothetical protein